jgi:hypothetical protein
MCSSGPTACRLFVEELTKAVLETVDRNGQTAAIAAAPPAMLAVPAALNASLISRLDRVGPSGKEIAQVGAVLGREFEQAPTEPALVITTSGAAARRAVPGSAALERSGLAFFGERPAASWKSSVAGSHPAPVHCGRLALPGRGPDVNLESCPTDLRDRLHYQHPRPGPRIPHGSHCGPTVPGVPIGCRSPRKRGPYSMPIHTWRNGFPPLP